MGCHPSFSTMDSRPQPMTCLVGVPPAIEAPRHCLRCFAQTSLNAVDAVSGHHPPKGSLIVSKHCFGCRKARPPQLPHVTSRRACRSSSRRSASAGAQTATVAANPKRRLEHETGERISRHCDSELDLIVKEGELLQLH